MVFFSHLQQKMLTNYEKDSIIFLTLIGGLILNKTLAPDFVELYIENIEEEIKQYFVTQNEYLKKKLSVNSFKYIKEKFYIDKIYAKDNLMIFKLFVKAFLILDEFYTKCYPLKIVFEIDVLNNKYNFLYCGENDYSISEYDFILSENFVPEIDKNDIEEYSIKTINKYFNNVSEFNSDIFVKRLGLNVDYKVLIDNSSINGQFFLKSVTKLFYNKKKNREEGMIVPERTIIVYKEAHFKQCKSAYDYTILHESSHYLLHKYLLFACYALNKDVNLFSWKIENQANVLARCFLMEKNSFIFLYNNLIKKYKNETGKDYLFDEYKKIVKELGKAFNVTFQLAKARLLDLGFEEIKGVLNFVDGKYVKAYFCKEKFLQYNQTFCISSKSLTDNINVFENLKGSYVFVENHLCLNDKKYIKVKKRSVELTEYARLHMDECCVVFEYKLNSDVYEKELENTIHKESRYEKISKCYQPIKNYKILEEYEEFSKTLNISNPGECFKNIKKFIGMKKDNIIELSDISVSTYERMSSGKSVSLETIIKVCVGMKLPSSISYKLVEAFGYSINNTKYSVVLNYYYLGGIDVVMKYLNDDLNE